MLPGEVGSAGAPTGQNPGMIHDSRHVTTSIEQPPHEVCTFAANPANLKAWASGLASSDVVEENGRVRAESPMGVVTIEFAPANPYGILDHVVTLPSGEAVLNPMRVIPNGDGCDVVFTVHRRTGMSAEEFEADCTTVHKDLLTLKRLVEGSVGGG
jgi:hypothetical protein